MTPGDRDSSESAGDQAQRLDREAAAVSEDASCVGQWHIDRLCAAAGPDVSAAQARSALERHGVRVAELPGLPAARPVYLAPYPDFTDCVARLGRKLSMELVFDNAAYGFRLLGGLRLDDGRRLDKEAIEEAVSQIPLSVDHDDWQRVLSILADAAPEPEVLEEIVWWEVAEVLRALARLSYPQRAIAEQAVRLSLERSEAEALAAAVAQEYQMRTISPPPRRQGTPEAAPPVPPSARAVVADAMPRPDPPAASPASRRLLEPITDLQSRPMPGRADIVQLSWTPPASGVVALRMAATSPPWPAGTALAAQEADAYGQPLAGDGMLGPDRRMSLELTLPSVRTFVTAFTVCDEDAASGPTVEITRGAPVRGLTWQRFGEEVRLTWEWPDDTVAAYVAWQPVLPPSQTGPAAGREQRKCSRRAFEAEGGFAAVMGHSAQRVEVWVVFKGPGREDLTSPAEIEVPAIGVLVPYGFRRVFGWPGLGRRRRREFVLTSPQPCVLPDLVIVEGQGPAMPLSPHDGEIVHNIPGGPIHPGRPVRTVVELRRSGPSWVVCFIDPAQPATRRTGVALAVPPVRQLRVR
jgi:hypothetical protein